MTTGLPRCTQRGLFPAAVVAPVVVPAAYPSLYVTVPATNVEYAARLTRCFSSIRDAQPKGASLSVSLVWLGPTGGWYDFGRMLEAFEVDVVEADPDPGPFCLARARNVGAQASPPQAEVLVFVDADVMVPQDMFVRLAHAMGQRRDRFVTCLTAMLDRKGQRAYVPPTGFGGFLAVRREDLFAIRGYDERYVGWGCEDNDVVDRLVWSGLEHYDIAHREGVLVEHQWHPSAGDPTDEKAKARLAANRWYYTNTESVVRNVGRPWGEARCPKSGR